MSDPGSVAIPPGLVEEMDRLYGEPGHAWLDRLPALVHETRERWSLEPDGPPRHGAHGLMIPVRRDGAPLALKIAYPDAVTTQEVTGLRAWDGHGTVHLLASSPAEGILLMERLDAGRDLTSLPIDDAVEAAGALTRRLAIAPRIDAPFVTSATRALDIATGAPAAWERAGRPFPASRLQRTIDFARSLADTEAGTLTTWDLHSENVLWGERAGWTMIDPMPMVGDPELALAPFLWTRAEEISGPGHLHDLLKGYVASGRLDADRTVAWLAVRLADYWLWGLGIGLTIDPERCRRLLGWLDPDQDA